MAIAYMTDAGQVRATNQDAVGAFYNQKGLALALVADGVTTQSDGDIASQMVRDTLGPAWEATYMTTVEGAKQWLVNQVTAVNHQILAASQSQKQQAAMATTLVLAVLFRSTVLIANLGDSKAFLYHKSTLSQLSFDHSLKNELVRIGKLSFDAAEQLENGNSVTRFLGVNDHVALEMSTHHFRTHDTLLLISDGITKVLAPVVLGDLLSQPAPTLQDQTASIIAAAKQVGAPDNITVLLATHE